MLIPEPPRPSQPTSVEDSRRPHCKDRLFHHFHLFTVGGLSAVIA